MHNGQRAYVNELIFAGDSVVVNIQEDNSSEKIPPVAIKLDILYEDEDLVIVNKPADMPVHPSLNNYENTLANGLAHYYISQGEKFVFRCMNRLDRNTTGAVLIAKNPLSGAILSEMIRDRKIDKEYVAVTEGKILAASGETRFEINAPIGRVTGSTIERRIDWEKGERAITHVKVLGYTNQEKNTVVSCILETGRTHQIRVHMSSIDHPLVGDGLYNPKYQDDVMHRHLLHCRKLEFEHPITHEHICVEAPYPEDVKDEYQCD